jgi:hypothetical protein
MTADVNEHIRTDKSIQLYPIQRGRNVIWFFQNVSRRLKWMAVFLLHSTIENHPKSEPSHMPKIQV